jgi:hypothetical protein
MAIWIAPGLTVILVSLVLTLTHIALALARRPNLPLALFAVRLRHFGIGLLFVGAGVNIALSALGQGSHILMLVLSALVAGLGGLYFIAAGTLFRKDKPLTEVSPKTSVGKRQIPIDKEEPLEAKAKRLHEMVHPEEIPQSKADRSGPS